MSENLTGSVLRGYEFHTELGQGGFGAVYRAHQALLKRDVAIKVILPEYANTPAFIRRFEVEAELIARLEHPNIVPLYDFWREPNGAFLVMRLVSGGSLRSVLERQKLEINQIATLLEQIAAALHVAHRENVVHRDIKPDNILLDNDLNGYLSDFGIATILGIDEFADDGLISGSVHYIPPEQFMGRGPSAQGDIYALGLTFYELLTGEHPFRRETVSEVIQSHLHTPVPNLNDLKPEYSHLDYVIQRATAKDPESRYETAIEFARAFREAMSDMGMGTIRFDDFVFAPVDLPNPYRGLQAFGESDSDKFYGRSALVERFLERLAENVPHQRFLAVIGASGSGKSSAVKAGLIPALRTGRLPNSENWFIAETVPGANPFVSLEEALLKVAVHPLEGLQQKLQGENGLHQVVKRLLPDDTSELLLIVDQFEELFTLVEDEAVRHRYMDNLIASFSHPQSRVRLIITLRADFYDKPLQYRQFGQVLRQRMETVLPLAPEELQEAIIMPATNLGVSYEQGLVDTIIADVGAQPGTLPLLQYALTELFERREGFMLNLAAYQGIGGVTGALARRADEVYEALGSAEAQDAARQLFLRLVSVGDSQDTTRRRIRRSELADTAVMEAVINRFGKSRLLTFDRDAQTREATLEVAHEAIIRNWQRLRLWIEESRSLLQIQNRLTSNAQEWEATKKNASYLATGLRLAQYEGLLDSKVTLSNLEAEYLKESIAQREEKRRAEEARKEHELQLQRQAANRLRYLVAVMLVFLVVAIGLTVFAFNQRANAETQAQIAERQADESRSLALAANAEEWADRDQGLALALAVEANSIADPPIFARTVLDELAYQPGVAYIWDSHRDRVISVAFSPDGRIAATGSGDTSARLWDVETGAERFHLTGHSDAVWIVAFSPDGSLLATGSADATIKLWSVETGRLLRTLERHTNQVRDLRFSPDGRLLLSGAFDSTAKLWSVTTGELIRTFEGHTENIFRVDIRPDAQQIVTASFDDTAIIWDLNTGAILHRLAEHRNDLRVVAYSPDGQTIATGSADSTAILWDANSGALVHRLNGHTDWVMNLAFSPNGETLVTGSADTTARLWNALTGELIHNFVGHADRIETLAFSPAGDMVLTGCWDSTSNLWSVGSGRLIHRFAGQQDTIKSVAFSPTGDYILTGSLDSTARLWDVTSPEMIKDFIGHTGAVLSVRFSPDGGTLLTGSVDGSGRLWSIASDETTAILDEPFSWLRSANYNADGTRIVGGGDDMVGYVWDRQTGGLIRQLEGHTGWIMSASYSPDSRFILTASLDRTARLWDAETGAFIRALEGHTGGLLSAAFSPDGSRIITGAEDDSVILWDSTTGAIIQQLPAHDDDVFAVMFSPDGRYFATASGDATAKIWDATSLELVFSLTGHTGDVRAVAFSPDGRWILTGSADTSARLWDATNGQHRHSYTGHSSEVVGVAFSPDSTQVATASWDRTIRLWSTNLPDDLVAWTFANWTVEELSCEQRALYGLEPLCDAAGVYPTRTPYPMNNAANTR